MRVSLPRIAFIVLATLLASFGQAQAQYEPRVGSPHPRFTLPALDDARPVSLADFRGKKVLLVQFAAW